MANEEENTSSPDSPDECPYCHGVGCNCGYIVRNPENDSTMLENPPPPAASANNSTQRMIGVASVHASPQISSAGTSQVQIRHPQQHNNIRTQSRQQMAQIPSATRGQPYRTYHRTNTDRQQLGQTSSAHRYPEVRLPMPRMPSEESIRMLSWRPHGHLLQVEVRYQSGRLKWHKISLQQARYQLGSPNRKNIEGLYIRVNQIKCINCLVRSLSGIHLQGILKHNSDCQGRRNNNKINRCSYLLLIFIPDPR